jgi:hypothetical protein
LASVSISFLIASRDASEYSSNGAGSNLSFIQIVLSILSWFSMVRMQPVYQLAKARRDHSKRGETPMKSDTYARSRSPGFSARASGWPADSQTSYFSA